MNRSIEQPTVKKPEKSLESVRFRAIAIGFVFALAICALTPLNNIQRQGTLLGGGHFPLAPFYLLIWMTLIVALARKVFKRRRWMTGRELLVAWILMVLVSGIGYTGLVRTFFINLTAPYHYASVENRWELVLHPLLPDAWRPQSESAIAELYNGLSGGRQMSWTQVLAHVPWGAWIQPILVWSVFILLCYFVMMCIVNLLNRQPLYNERMNFPLLRVPMLMEQALDENWLGRFFTNRFFVAGCLVPVVLHLINGLNFYYPAVPQIPTLFLGGPYFPKQGLFSGFVKLQIYIYPAFIGFAFLTSKQISFSFWAFFLMGGLLFGLLGIIGYDIPAAALGVTFGPTLSRPEETQMIGAYAVFFGFLFWLARHHLWQVTKQGFGLAPDDASDAEWFSIRTTFWGWILGSMGIMLWLNYFGMPLLAAFLLVCAFFMVLMVATRIICQGGLPYFTLTVAPLDGLLVFFGPKLFAKVGILIAGVTQKVLFVDLRESLMPSLMHARKVTDRTSNNRTLAYAIMATLIMGVVVSFVAMLALCYKFGIRELRLDWANRTTVSVYDNIYALLEMPVNPGNWVIIFTVIGAVVMLGLVIGYHRFYWWPIHPIGYLTTYSSAMRILWASFFLGWLSNALCMRYGGVTLFKQLRFFFIGLIVGDFFMGGTWAIVGLFSDISYHVLPV